MIVTMMKRLLDLRFVIGLFFLVMGVMLVVYGFFGGSNGAAAVSGVADDSTINRFCGGIFGVFGVFMIGLHFWGRRGD